MDLANLWRIGNLTPAELVTLFRQCARAVEGARLTPEDRLVLIDLMEQSFNAEAGNSRALNGPAA